MIMTLKYGDPGYMEQDVSPRLYAITFTCLGVALLVVALRLFSRLCLLKSRHLNLAECLIVVAAILDIASCVLIHFQIQTGMGKHIEYSRERPAMLQASMKVGLAQNSVYQALIGLIKASICAQLYALAIPGLQQKIILCTGFVVGVFTLFTTFAAIFQCIPMSAAWNLDTFPKGCWNMMAMNFFTSTVNTILDLVLFCLPIRTLLGLQMERKKKASLLFSYFAGTLAIACAVIRLRNIIYFRGVGDFTYEASMVPVWGAIECNAGIVCASFPFIMPLIKRMSGSLVDSVTQSYSRSNYGLTAVTTHKASKVDQKSWPLRSNRQSQYHHMDSESIKRIVDDSEQGWQLEKPASIKKHGSEHVELQDPAGASSDAISWSRK